MVVTEVRVIREERIVLNRTYEKDQTVSLEGAVCFLKDLTAFVTMGQWRLLEKLSDELTNRQPGSEQILEIEFGLYTYRFKLDIHSAL